MTTPRVLDFGSPEPEKPTQKTLVTPSQGPTVNLSSMFASEVSQNLPAVVNSTNITGVTVSSNDTGITSSVPTCTIPLLPADQAKVAEMVAKFDVTKLRPEQVGQIGISEQKSLTDEILRIMDAITKANSPTLYELAELFLKGKEGINFSEIQEKIKKAQENPGMFQGFVNILTRKSPAQALKALIEDIDKVLRPQAQKLSDNMRKIEEEHGKRIQDTIQANEMLKQTGNAFLARVPVFAQMTHFLYGITGNAKQELARLESIANQTQIANDRHAVMEYRQVVDLLMSRSVALNTQYYDIEPTLVGLTNIIGGNNAAISESTNTFYTTFTQLLKNMMMFHGAVTGLNTYAGSIRMQEVVSQMSGQNQQLTEKLTLEAIQGAGKRRLEEAQRVLEQVDAEEKLAQKILDARKGRDADFDKTEALLRQVAQKMPNITLLEKK